MIEGVSRLLENVTRRDDPLIRAKRSIDQEKYKVMGHREEFVAWLDDLLRDFALEAKRRALSETEARKCGKPWRSAGLSAIWDPARAEKPSSVIKPVLPTVLPN
jgi:hypothetical protein